MRIVIADDEQWVRAALKEMLLEADPRIEIVGEAFNGGYMAELVEEKQPDIVFVDIRMPQISGLEGIAKAKEKNPDIAWIILSGYSDFEYAQQAISLGVQEYLLKPVSPEKLRETLLNVQKQKAAKKTNRNTDFRNWLISSFYMERQTVKNEDFGELQVMGMLLCLDTWLGSEEREKYWERMSELLTGQIEKLNRYGNVYSAFFEAGQGKMILVAGTGLMADEGKKVRIKEWFDALQKEFAKISDIHAIMIGIRTRWCDNAAEMFDCLNKEERSGYCRIAMGIDRIWQPGELEKCAEAMGQRKLRLCERLMNIAKGMQKGSYLHFIGCMTEAEREWVSCRGWCTNNEHANMKRYLAVTAGLNRFFTREEFSRMELGEALAFTRENAQKILLRGKASEKETNVVGVTESYIREHYGEDISVAQIAGQLSLTPNYLSALFHKKTGTTFVKYLTRIRMLEAENLLINTELPVWRIAEQTGFSDTKYFTKIFKDYFGILPSEYRKQKKEEKI